MNKILLPELGEGINDVEIRDILVEEGDSIQKDQTILILETDKASMEIPSDYEGVVSKIYVKTGDKISPNDHIIDLQSKGDEKSAVIADTDTLETTPVKEKENQTLSKEVANTQKEITLQSKKETQSTSKVLAAPSIRKLARELGCDIKLVSGSGDKGRITKNDVLGYVNQHLSDESSSINSDDLRKILKDEISLIKDDIMSDISNLNKSKTTKESDHSKWGLTESKKLNKIKIATARNMSSSWSNIPQVTQFDNADITSLYKSYKKIKEGNKDKNIKVSLIPFYMKVLSKAISEFPTLNSSLNSNQDAIIIKKYVNIGVAVDTINGLVVPVIKNCERKSIKELNIELTKLSEKAKDGKLDINDISGGSITISSLGGIGGTNFTPIVFEPQVAILGFSKAEYKFVNYKDKFVKRLILPFSLTYDHRVIDGAEAVKFTTKISDLLSSVRLLRK